MMKSTTPRTLLRCVLKTVGETAIFMSHWCVLQSFVQAAMWHNTEPRTLGISYWATGLFVAALCLPGLIYLLKCVLCSSTVHSNFCNKVTPFLLWIIRVCPATALTISSLPQLDEYAGARTCTLSLGIIFINLYVISIAWKAAENNANSDGNDIQKAPECAVISGDEKTFSHIGNDLVLAICGTMAVRWCSGTINIFYENWHASLSITLLVFVYASVVLVFEHSSKHKNTFTSTSFTGSKLSESNAKQRMNDDRGETLPFKTDQTTAVETASSSSDKYSSETTNQYDEFDRRANIHDADNKENHQLNDNNAVVVSVTGDNNRTRQVCVAASYCYALIYAFVIGPALGALASIFIWIFTSPDVLCLWGEVSVKSMGYLIMVCFVVGCMVAAVMDLERLCYGEEVELCADTKEKLKVKRNAIYRMITCGIFSCLMAVGTSLILYTKGSLFLFGSSILCLIIPSTLRMTLYMSYDLVMTSKSLQTLGKISSINAVPGLLLCLSGSTFVVFYFLGICFVNPQITHIFHGRMDLILLPKICLCVLPLLFGPALRSRVNTVDRLRSSSTGPLLEGDAMNSMCNTSDVSFSESHNTKIKPSSAEKQVLKQYTKTIQAMFLLLLLVIVVVVKYVSMSSTSTCDVAISGCDDIELRKGYDLRVMSWNILLGHKMNGRTNLNEIAYHADYYNPHVLALQEAAGLPAYWGGKDVLGYLETSTKSCFNRGKIINPMLGSLEVGLLSRVETTERSAAILPNGGVNKIPSYTMAKISFKLPSKCDSREELGSGDIIDISRPQQQNSTLHIYTIHAVYKNWTCERYSKLSCEQMTFLQDDIRKLPIDDPVIVMGDFNINPSESELDMWYQGDLGFKSALWPSMAQNSKFNGRCEGNPNPPNDECDCECRNNLSDPPKSTLLNRRAAVDHIFYRGLRLVGEAKILYEVGQVSDHYPILADFAFQ